MVFTLGLESEHIPEKEKKKENINGFFHYFNVLYLVLIFVGFHVFVQERLLTEKKPDPKDIAARAHWLVFQNFWGVLKYAQSPFLLSSLLAQNGYSCVV